MTPETKRSEKARPDKARPESRRSVGRRGLDRIRPEASREPRTSRLDTPQDAQRALVRRPSFNPDTFGRFAEQFARFMGTATFLIYMTLFVAVWVIWNLLAPHGARFDTYPFIFLTLILSLQASYAAPLILLAQNRQEDRDRVVGEQDRRMNVASHADMEFLAREVASLRMSVGEVATRDFLRSELRGLLTELEERSGSDGGEAVTHSVTGDDPEDDPGADPGDNPGDGHASVPHP